MQYSCYPEQWKKDNLCYRYNAKNRGLYSVYGGKIHFETEAKKLILQNDPDNNDNRKLKYGGANKTVHIE